MAPAAHQAGGPDAEVSKQSDPTSARASRAWFLYLIECRDGSLYTGIAVDVARRYVAHVAGKGARYTRSHPPRRLAAVLPCADHGAALRAEHLAKRLSPAAKRELCRRHPPPNQIEA